MIKRICFLLSLLMCGVLYAQDITYRTVKDLSYSSSKDPYATERCKLDVYYPENKTGCPVVVWFHGGGLTQGNKSIPGRLKKNGMVVIAVNYRLLPKVAISECLDDAAASVAWAFREVEKYGGDKNKIFISGHSAGGYLTAMVGLDKRWLKKYDIDADSIAGLIPFSGQVISHFSYRKMNGIDNLQPTVLITGDRELELFGRYEENAYMWRMMKLVGHKETFLYEIGGHGHGPMGDPAFYILKQHIKRILGEPEK